MTLDPELVGLIHDTSWATNLVSTEVIVARWKALSVG